MLPAGLRAQQRVSQVLGHYINFWDVSYMEQSSVAPHLDACSDSLPSFTLLALGVLCSTHPFWLWCSLCSSNFLL